MQSWLYDNKEMCKRKYKINELKDRQKMMIRREISMRNVQMEGSHG